MEERSLEMKRLLKSRLAWCVLIFTLAGVGIVFATDVVVKPSKIEVLWVETSYVDAHNIDASGNVDIDGNIEIGGGTLLASGVTVVGKVYSTGGYDPPYVMYDRQTRAQIVNRISQEVPSGKLGGAALFFNADTKRLEVYVAAEGAFYDLQGKLLQTLPQPASVTAVFEDAYYLEPDTGEVKSFKKAVYDRYVTKKGYELDSQTGQFIELSSGLVVTREEAVEIQPAGQ